MKKTLLDLLKRYPDKISSVDDESFSGDGYWINLKPGWSLWGEVHMVHEWTMKDLLSSWRCVERCECEECKRDLAITPSVRWSTKQKVLDIAKDLRCACDFERWEISAPANRAFVANDCHTLVFEPQKDDGPSRRAWTRAEKEEAYRDALSRLRYGLKECHCGECDPQEEGK